MYTAAALAAANPMLLKGEVVYESDTRKRKVGDGVTSWNALAYESDGGGSSTSGRTVIVSNLTWNGAGYLTIKVPVRTFDAQPNYIIRGYYRGPSGQFAFSCETCGVLQVGIDNALPGFVRTSSSQSYVMEVNTDWIDPTDDDNPIPGEAAFSEINILMRGYTAGVGTFYVTMIEEIP